MPPTHRTNRFATWISAALLIAGSTLFLAGGSQHPRAATAFGVVGTDAFYRTFASHIQHHPNWIAIHVLILIGPVLWALGLPRAHESGAGSESSFRSTLENLASRAMLLGAGLWTVVFVLDGFVAPQAASIIASGAPADLPGLVATFRLNQVAVIRLGLFSWVLIGTAMALYGGATIARAHTLVSGRTLLGAAGVLIGIWPIVATITGDFEPGPFTSARWSLTALATGLWFAAFGVSLLVRERAAATHTAKDAARDSAPDLALQG